MTRGYDAAKRDTMKRLLALLLAPAALSARPAAALAAPSAHIAIGWQKGGSLAVIEGRGELQKNLAAHGIGISWIEFPAGPQMLEALNVGSIDFGMVGETPPVFAQAAGADLVYVGNDPAAPRAERILVPKDSPIRQVADLKGRRIALNKGSNVHYLLVKLLEKAGLRYGDVQVVFLVPADARAAFERGSIDAWVIWDPYAAAVESKIDARTLADGTGAANNYIFFMASRRFATENAAALELLLQQINAEEHWIEQHLDESAAIVAPQIGVSDAVARLALSRYAYGVQPLTDDVVRQQQEIADVFHQLGLIPKRLDVASVVWRPAKSGEKS